jgi:serine/threonine protein kinase
MARLAPALKRLLERDDETRRLGPFTLRRQLGRGGYAPVWLAEEKYGGTVLRLAALKLFALADAGASYRERVVEEARLLCRVEHPNVVRFYSLVADDASGLMGVAMEFLTGTSLEARLADGPLSLLETLDVGASIASALSAVHRSGLLHRDVKPANIIDSAGVHKLIDFGVAAADDAPPADTGVVRRAKPVLVDDLPLEVSQETRRRIPGAVTLLPPGSGAETPSSLAPRGGTIGYVDPACIAHGAPETPASDLYALGVTLFECITGQHPAAVVAGVGGGMSTEVLDGRRAAPPLCAVARDAPAALGDLVDALLRADVERRPRSAEWVAIELERIRGQAAGLARALPPEDVGPFRGLGRFEESDRDVYFGRGLEIAAALELLRSHGMVALVGPSGSGKSSLARAGVLPRVVEGALGPWPTRWDAVVTVPGADPRSTVLDVLRELPEPPALGDGRPMEVVAALTDRVQRSGRGVVILVDQLEELVTASLPEPRRWLADFLGQLADPPRAGVRAVTAVRRDLLDPLLAESGLGRTLVRGSLLVEPMTDATWSEVLSQALAAYGYALDGDALRAELLGQLKGTAGAMPLVQFALTELWKKRDRERRRITRSGLTAIGGIAGALERHAESTVARIGRRGPNTQSQVRDVLLALTTPQGTRATRRLEELPGGADARAVVQELEEARLVVRDAGAVTLAHEALLTQWGRLSSWVSEVRGERLLAEELEADARRADADADAVPLWRKRRLAAAEELRLGGHVTLSPAATAFLGKSRSAERRGRVAGAAAIAATMAVAAGAALGWMRAVVASERNAVEMAAAQEQRAQLEQQKRAQLEEAQVELDRRQREIEALVGKLADASDPAAVRVVQQQIDRAQQGARAARARIATAPQPPKSEPTDAAVAAPPPSATPTSTAGEVPTFKVQTW